MSSTARSKPSTTAAFGDRSVHTLTFACRAHTDLSTRRVLITECIDCPDGHVCLLDFALLRRLEPEYLDGERDVMRAVIDADPLAVHRALAHLGYLANTETYDPALLEYLLSYRPRQDARPSRRAWQMIGTWTGDLPR